MKKINRFAWWIIAVTLFFASNIVTFAKQPQITWLDNVYSFNREGYGEGLFPVSILEGEIIYTALSPEGAISTATGYIDRTGKVVIPYKYLNGSPFLGGYAKVGEIRSKKKGGGVYSWTASRIINKAGEPIPGIDALYDAGYFLKTRDKDHVLWLEPGENQLWGLSNTFGKLILPIQFEYLELPQENLCLAKKGGLYGFVDLKGQVIVDFQYEEAKSFSENLAAVKLNGSWGYIDKTNKWVISPQYREADSFSEGIASIRTTDGEGAINKNNKIVIPTQFDQVGKCSENRIKVKKSNRFAYFDSKGEKVIDFLYGAALDFHDGISIVSVNDFSGYDREEYWRWGKGPRGVWRYKNAMFGAIDLWGNTIMPFEYISISDFHDGVAMCFRAKDEKIGIVKKPLISTKDPGNRKFIRLYINNKYIYSDQDPVIENERTLVPLRVITENLGATVNWDNEQKLVTITANDLAIELKAGSTLAKVNSEEIKLDIGVKVVNGRTMVPIRFISEQMNKKIMWDNTKRSVNIY